MNLQKKSSTNAARLLSRVQQYVVLLIALLLLDEASSDQALDESRRSTRTYRDRRSLKYSCKYYRKYKARILQEEEEAAARSDRYGGKKTPLDDTNIQNAVNQWINNRTGALIEYGHIKDWDVYGVTWMRSLFKDQVSFLLDIMLKEVDDLRCFRFALKYKSKTMNDFDFDCRKTSMLILGIGKWIVSPICTVRIIKADRREAKNRLKEKVETSTFALLLAAFKSLNCSVDF